MFCYFDSLLLWCCVCVCQALFQRVTHKKVRSNSSQQGVPEMDTGLAPTKTPVCHLWYQSGTLDWRTCQNIVILPFSVQPWTWGCCRYLYRLVMTCSKNYLLPTHRFAVITHAWTWAVVHHIDACIYHTSVSSLVDFRKPPCGTAPSVIPIHRGNIATFCRRAFLTLFFFFPSFCFSPLLPGEDMS